MNHLRRLLLLSCVLLAAGCVWSRLLDFKNQLKDFDRHFTPVEAADGSLLLTCTEPCARPGDFGYLLGDEQPTTHDAEVWTYRLHRNHPGSIGLDLTLHVTDGLTTAVRIPPEVLRFLPPARFLALARAMGKADIDRDRKEASTSLTGPDAQPLTPGRDKVLRALGEPDAVLPGDGSEELRYVYHLLAADGTPGPSSDLRLTLVGERLTAIRFLTPKFNAWLKLGGQP